MSFLKLFARKLSLFIILICLVGIGSITLFLLGYRDTASTLSHFGTAVVVLGTLAYVVVYDSKKRFPKDGWFIRLHKVLTFQRR